MDVSLMELIFKRDDLQVALYSWMRYLPQCEKQVYWFGRYIHRYRHRDRKSAKDLEDMCRLYFSESLLLKVWIYLGWEFEN